MNRKKKVLSGVGIFLLAFFILAAFGSQLPDTEQPAITQQPTSTLEPEGEGTSQPATKTEQPTREEAPPEQQETEQPAITQQPTSTLEPEGEGTSQPATKTEQPTREEAPPEQQETLPVFVRFVDVGQGDGTLITHDSYVILIDAGTRRGGGETIVDRLQAEGLDHIDLLVVTHPDADHIAGLITVLESDISIDVVLQNGQAADTKTYRDFMELAQQINVTIAERSQEFVLGDLIVTVLNPIQPLEFSDRNENSIVLRLSHGNIDFLLTGDCEIKCEKSILSSGLPVASEVLKIGHHGSQSSTSKPFLIAVNPQVGVVSAGLNNRYGHPHDEVMTRLQAHNVTIYATYVDGDVLISSSGDEYDVLDNPTPLVVSSE